MEDKILNLILTFDQTNLILAEQLCKSQNININDLLNTYFSELFEFSNNSRYFNGHTYNRKLKHINNLLSYERLFRFTNSNLLNLNFIHPSFIFKMIWSLDISGNNILEFNLKSTNFPILESLVCNRSNIKNIKCNGNFENLKSIRFEYNDISRLDLDVENFKELNYLFLDYNKFKYIPNFIWDLQNLSQLHISKNELVELNIPKNYNKSLGLHLTVNNNIKHEIKKLKYTHPNIRIFEDGKVI